MGRRRRAATPVVLAAAILLAVWLLFAVVFPWVDRRLSDPVLDAEPGDAVVAQIAVFGIGAQP